MKTIKMSKNDINELIGFLDAEYIAEDDTSRDTLNMCSIALKQQKSELQRKNKKHLKAKKLLNGRNLRLQSENVQLKKRIDYEITR